MTKATLYEVTSKPKNGFCTAYISLGNHYKAIKVQGAKGSELNNRVQTILDAFNDPEDDDVDRDYWEETCAMQAQTIEMLKNIIMNSDIDVIDVIDSF